MQTTGGLRQYYVAVSEDALKLVKKAVRQPTLVDLLLALVAEGPLQAIVSCSSRDSLDAVVGGVRASAPQAEVAFLHADLLPEEVDTSLRAFADGPTKAERPLQRRSPKRHTHVAHADQLPEQCLSDAKLRPEECESLRKSTEEQQQAPAQVLVVTDIMFKILRPDSLPRNVSLLINYDLPLKKDVYQRQIQLHAPAGSELQRIIIFFAVAGRMGDFRALESSAVGSIDVMPVHAADIFSALPVLI